MLQITRYVALLFLLIFSIQVKAQKDPKAKSVLDAMSTKYQAMNGFTANFDFTYSDAGGVSDKQSGEIAVKAEKYRLKLPDQEIFNNGKTVWTYIVTDTYKEVTVNDVSQMEGELTPSNIYRMYEEGFDYSLKGEKLYQGQTVQVVELVAQQSGAPFERVNLMINKASKNLMGWEMFDGQGGTFSYTFVNLKTATNLAESYFTFDPKSYPGVEIIDLR
ncbi:outer membrane lipoprotein carrier protein LolA [Algoriphagus namhaensis]|uniref:Outer membrane lipoprotein carrier protein LolA n=1 Tax=Algoriphagus namhaensis TaxID=915353 RepID=A0ABV8AN23_9BACT